MNTDQAREQVSLAIDQTRLKEQLKQRVKLQLVLNYAGGTFMISTELLAFLHLYKDRQQVVLPDAYTNPVLIDNIAEFTDQCMARYEETMNEWHAEYAKIKTLRPKSEL